METKAYQIADNEVLIIRSFDPIPDEKIAEIRRAFMASNLKWCGHIVYCAADVDLKSAQIPALQLLHTFAKSLVNRVPDISEEEREFAKAFRLLD